jgi:hypothetical protein
MAKKKPSGKPNPFAKDDDDKDMKGKKKMPPKKGKKGVNPFAKGK